MSEDDADFLAWAEHQVFAELEPGQQVAYAGGVVAAHGLWIVHERIGDDYYTLKHPDKEWERLNADRLDLTPIDTGMEAPS